MRFVLGTCIQYSFEVSSSVIKSIHTNAASQQSY